jgi:predicted PurR-regulated permease PerM
MQKEKNIPGKRRVSFLFILAVAVTLMFFWVIKGFGLSIVVAIVLAGLAHPIHSRFSRKLNGRKGVAATMTVLLVLIIVIVPAFLFLGVLIQDAATIRDNLEPWVAEHIHKPGNLQQVMEQSPTLQKIMPYQDQIIQKAGELAGKTASFMAQALVGWASGAAEFCLMFLVALYGMFYFLKEGRVILDRVFDYTPLSVDDKQCLVSTFNSVARATIKGTLVIGIVQGGLAAAAFAVAGIEGVVFWGVIMAVLSIIPGIGSALVWIPAVVYLALIGRVGAAVGLTAWCAIVVGTADNFLRPVLVGKDTKMPDLMVLLTTLGGLVLFGAAGIVIGPIVGALFTAVWTLWGTAVRDSERAFHGTAPEATKIEN